MLPTELVVVVVKVYLDILKLLLVGLDDPKVGTLRRCRVGTGALQQCKVVASWRTVLFELEGLR